jgi:hypothetical protein
MALQLDHWWLYSKSADQNVLKIEMPSILIWSRQIWLLYHKNEKLFTCTLHLLLFTVLSISYSSLYSPSFTLHLYSSSYSSPVHSISYSSSFTLHPYSPSFTLHCTLHLLFFILYSSPVLSISYSSPVLSIFYSSPVLSIFYSSPVLFLLLFTVLSIFYSSSVLSIFYSCLPDSQIWLSGKAIVPAVCQQCDFTMWESSAWS